MNIGIPNPVKLHANVMEIGMYILIFSGLKLVVTMPAVIEGLALYLSLVLVPGFWISGRRLGSVPSVRNWRRFSWPSKFQNWVPIFEPLGVARVSPGSYPTVVPWLHLLRFFAALCRSVPL
jgi:hypothetical protein